MPEIFTTPCKKTKQNKLNLLHWIFRAKSLHRQNADNRKLLAMSRYLHPVEPDGAMTLNEQIHLARQTRLNVQNTLAQQTFSDASSLKLNNTTASPLSDILEDISQNISKMDQNLYTAKANMEEILRTHSKENEFVALS